jgi:hypothetical protein
MHERSARRRLTAASLLCAGLIAWSATGGLASALATTPGPPNVEVVPPEVVLDERGEVGVTFDPGLILFTYDDGTQSACVLDPALPPNPCSELATNPGPPDVEVVAPEAIFGDDGALLGFVSGYVRITFGDGSQRTCILDPLVPPSPCEEPKR